jgi:pyruvate,orthophosphate dikinase
MYGSVVNDLPKKDFADRLDARRKSGRTHPRHRHPVAELKAWSPSSRRSSRTPPAALPRQSGRSALGRDHGGLRELEHARARDYRALHDIPDSLGTAVNVVTMVFGNMGEDSATGVAFTRNPSTARTRSMASSSPTRRARTSYRRPDPGAIEALAKTLPKAAEELRRVARTLERHFRDVQDLEFTIERGTLYMLQTRRAQRSGHAAVRIACAMVDEGSITEEKPSRGPARGPRAAPASDHRSRGHARPDHHRPPCISGCGLGHGGVQSRHRPAPRQEGRGGDPGAAGHESRRFPRDGDLSRDPHRARAA